MKAPMTNKEFEEAPGLVQLIWMNSWGNIPMGVSTYLKAIADHPEYFPEEVEHQKKWDSIPQSVHDAYRAEWTERFKELNKDSPPQMGILYWFDHPEELKELRKFHDKVRPLEQKMEKELHEKYYSAYGLKYHGTE
jgi:hypothetical protein